MRYSPLKSNIETHPGKSIYLYLVALVFCFIIAYAPVLKVLVNTWSTSDDYSHGFFVLPICLYICWQKKEELSRIDILPSMWGVCVCGLSLAIYYIASLSEIQTLSAITIVPLWGGVILYLCGYQMLRAVRSNHFWIVPAARSSPSGCSVCEYLTFSLRTSSSC